MTTNNNISYGKDKAFPIGKQDNYDHIVHIELQDTLEQKEVIEDIVVNKKTNTITVILNHGYKKKIVSVISPNWNKTRQYFEKQAKLAGFCNDDIRKVQDILDDNHETILEGILNCHNDNGSNNDQSLTQNAEKQSLLKEIDRLRAENSSITGNEWRDNLQGKYLHLREVVEKNLPNLWEGLEFELSVLKILNIGGCNLPFAGIILGPPSSLKTQIIELLRSWLSAFYTDNFSAKSFVSHTTAVPREQLTEIDLLPKIKDKCLLSPELAPTFASKDDDLVQILGIKTRILDGNGYESDSGVQGHRGYRGKFMFTWVGAAVDIPHKVHKYLGNLGPKLYFIRPKTFQIKTEKDYVDQIKNDNFNRKIADIKEVLFDYLKWFEIGPELVTDKETGLAKMLWNSELDDEYTRKYIVRLARLLGHLRGVAPTWNTYGTQGSDYAYTLPTIEEPDRAIQQLTNLAKGHAISQGRNYTTLADIPMIINVVLSTASKERVSIFDLLLANNGTLTTTEISISLNLSSPTARRTMLELWVLR
jgi:hypothetical protein